MLFSTPFFVYLFLPLFFALYWISPKRAWVLLAGSLLFYGWGEPQFLGVILVSTAFDWFLGRGIAQGGRYRKLFLALGVGSNLGLLVYAKYVPFAVGNINELLTHLGMRPWTIPQIALPLAISFIVFEKITYLVDLYRGVAKPARSLLYYINYVFLFPKLLAGPIVKYHDISEQLERPTHRYDDVRDGLTRFVRGLAKKMLIADFLGPFSDEIFKLSPGELNMETAWLGLLCFTLQIYFDFSGYSDMAIGLSRILGFRLQENFNHPYLATSFTDFWRRWHISLSSWIREYLYIPLGGNRVSAFRSYVNLSICFFLSGLWHGASWNFVIWGCFHGMMLILDRAFLLDFQKRFPAVINRVFTVFLVAIGWVFFRCETFKQATTFLTALFSPGTEHYNKIVLDRDILTVIVVALLIILLPLIQGPRLLRFGNHAIPKLLFALLLLILCTGWMGLKNSHPFLYFRF